MVPGYFSVNAKNKCHTYTAVIEERWHRGEGDYIYTTKNDKISHLHDIIDQMTRDYEQLRRENQRLKADETTKLQKMEIAMTHQARAREKAEDALKLRLIKKDNVIAKLKAEIEHLTGKIESNGFVPVEAGGRSLILRNASQAS
jgi:predicted RNase H-like nuclease (RuvC/YqgF family)